MGHPMKRDSGVADAESSLAGEHRGWRRWLGVFGAPGAWLTQVALSAPLAAQWCYPGRVPLTVPAWDALEVALAAISVVCFLVALASTWLTGSALHVHRALREADQGVLEVGEGRAAFLSVLVAMSSLLFTIGTLFSAQAVWLVAGCGGGQ
mgnify:CR=1 FL=1